MAKEGKLTFLRRIYLVEILRGLGITIRHLVGNLLNMGKMPTIEYPDERREYSPRFRGRHRLRKNDDGSIRCVACMLCATICPSKCITIEAEEVDDPAVVKRPTKYEIDGLRCIYCGLCVEACPKYAIEMTGVYDFSDFTREAFKWDREKLSNW